MSGTKRKSTRNRSQSETKRTKPANFKDWSEADICQHFEDCGLSDVGKLLQAEEISGRNLFLLNEDHLAKLGISKLGKRLDTLNAINDLKRKSHMQNEMNNGELETKVFNDPIHGHIELHPLCVQIVDTPQFQRLRNLRQLGGCYFVFPGASHNRFEHCIGVCHLAGELVKALQSRQPELGITDRDVLCVQIAGLCHDLGHGPFSHMFDGLFIPAVRPGYEWRHEDASVQMFEYLLKDNDLLASFEKYGLDVKTDCDFIKEQIAGPQKHNGKSWCYKGRPENMSFLYEIVANKRNGVDVDKWDYFARDCHHLGITCNFDHRRFMKFARVLDVSEEGGGLQICTRDKEVGNVYDMFHTRHALHRRAYQHKTNTIVEVMITEALLKAEPHMRITGANGKRLKLSETIDDMAAYLKLTDNIYQEILFSDDPNLEESRAILRKIQKRELYKCVAMTKVKKGKTIKKAETPGIAEAIIECLHEEHVTDAVQLTTSDLVVKIVSLDYGMKDQDPIKHVRFYSKLAPTRAIRVRREEVSEMLPETFQEQHIRCYSKKRDEASRCAVKLAFDKWCDKFDIGVPRGGDVSSLEMTPIKPPVSSLGPSPTRKWSGWSSATK